MFSSTFFAGNRSALRAKTDVDFVILSANGMVQKSADLVFPFRQDSNFWYLTGCTVADAVFVLDVQQGVATVILPPRLKQRDAWEGVIDREDIKKNGALDVVIDADEGQKYLRSISKQKPRIGTIVPDGAYIAAYGLHFNPAKMLFKNRLKRLFGASTLVDIRIVMAGLRQVKQPQELEAIQKAIDITIDSFEALKKELPHMQGEQDIDIFVSHQFRLRGGKGHAYDPIVGCGEHAATIHYETNDGPLAANSLLLMDIGAEYEGYAADISRTWALGEPSDKQRAVYDAVKATHQYALSLLKPGVVIREYQKQVAAYQVDQLIQRGIIAAKDRKTSEANYPHLVSHFLGLDVHDAGLYEEPLPVGAVITVEPGYYMQAEKIGVRIEDDVLITQDGAVNLSARLSDNLVY